MEKLFTKQVWHNDAPPSIDEENLNRIENAIDGLDDRVVGLNNAVESIEGGGLSADYQFSNDPQIVGWWPDGRPIYERTYDIKDEKGSSFDIANDDTNYKWFLSASGSAYSNTRNKRVNIPYNDNDGFVGISVSDEDKSMTVNIDSSGYKNFYISVRYGGKIILKSPAMWATGTPKEISNMLQAHYDGDIDIYDYWNIGDTRKIKLSEMPNYQSLGGHQEQDIEMVLVNKGGFELMDGTECAFVVLQKDVLTGYNSDTGYFAELAPLRAVGGTNMNFYELPVYQWLSDVYKESFPKDMVGPVFKEFKYLISRYFTGVGKDEQWRSGYFTFPSYTNFTGKSLGGASLEGTLWEYYSDLTGLANVYDALPKRIKYCKGTDTPCAYYTRSSNGGGNSWQAVSVEGYIGSRTGNVTLGVVCHGVI